MNQNRPYTLSLLPKCLKIWHVLLLIFLNSFGQLSAQVDREFWFAIPKETRGHGTGNFNAINYISFRIANTSSNAPAHVTIEMPGNPAFFPILDTIKPGMANTVKLADNWADFEKIYANPSLVGSLPVTGFNNRGIHIVSDIDITVYYDFDNFYNRDLFSLKGKNALGTEFFTPFQYIWHNDSSSYAPAPVSSIEIVATEDSTIIDITPPTTTGNSAIFQGRPNNSPYQIKLNRGETYSLVSRYRSARSHPGGTRISSNKKITVTTNDDSVRLPGDCRDINGDQLVPVSILKNKYLVMTGSQSRNNPPVVLHDPDEGEQIIVCATRNNTCIRFYNEANTLLYTTPVLNNGQQDYYTPDISQPNNRSIFIQAVDPVTFNPVTDPGKQLDTTNRFAVWHISGVGCEIGGAIVPPISDCTGSSQVTIFRSSTVASCNLNLMIRLDPALPPNDIMQPYNFFILKHGDKSLNDTIPGSWFGINTAAGWAVLSKAGKTNLESLIKYEMAEAIINSADVFHLGMINGTGGRTNKYGYFSSFNADSAAIRVADPVNVIKEKEACFGDPIFLSVSGGLEYTWYYGVKGGPSTYLSDPKSATPQVSCPVGQHKFVCLIKRARCFKDTTLYVDITVYPQIISAFTTDKTTICDPDKIVFTATNVGATNYVWEKNGVAIHPLDPLNFTENFINVNKGTTPKHYTYQLTATKVNGCPNPVSKTITVYPQIKALFTTNPLKDTIGCHPKQVIFVNKSNGNVTDSTFFWDFGDLSTSNAKTPTHIFQNLFGDVDSVYHTKLIATSPYYCRDTARMNFHIHPFIQASFTADTVNGCSPLEVTLFNNSLNKPAIKDSLGNTNYFWDFGDGTTSTSGAPSFKHTFPPNVSNDTVGYRVTLTVKNNSPTGCPSVISRWFTVYPQAEINFSPGPQGYCDSTVVQFNAFPNAAVTSYLWDFGDGNTSTEQNPLHLFRNLTENIDTVTVRLTGLSNQYCNGDTTREFIIHPYLDPQFAIDLPSNCAPFDAKIINKSRGGIDQYNWNFGDGSSIKHTRIDTIHTFKNFTNSPKPSLVQLEVTNNNGVCKKSTSQWIDVFPEIKANFSLSNTRICHGDSVIFNYTPPPGNTVAKFFHWEFGDGNSSSDNNPTHTFGNTTFNPVAYKVKLTVTSANNCTDDTTKDVLVYPYLKAKFSVDSVNGCSPFPVTITNASLGKIDQYLWTYGDGTTDGHSSLTYKHTYLNNQAINPSNVVLQRYLKLQTSNTNGTCNSRDSVLISIYPEVQAFFQPDYSEGCNPLTVKFTKKTGTTPRPLPLDYYWSFGDNGTFVAKSNATDLLPPATHTYTNLSSTKKEFIATLRTVSQHKCSHTFSDTITVYPFIKADFAFDQSAGCSPYTITIRNSSSSGANIFYWYMGDKPVQRSPNSFFPPYTYRNQTAQPVSYAPKLVVFYNNGIKEMCKDSAIRNVTIYPEVTADFTQDTLKICSPGSITFTNNSRIGPHKLLPYNTDSTYTNWSFGDNGRSSQFDPGPHFYTNYSNTTELQRIATLDITSKYLCKSSKSKTVTIYPKPKAVFEVDKTIDCPPFALPIQNLSETEPIANFNWNFGDGNSFTTQVNETVTHTFDNLTPDIASYNLELSIETEHNCTDMTTQTISAYPHVIADFSPDTAGCSPLTILFKNKTLRAEKYLWDFGDQVTNKIVSPTHKYFNPEIYDSTYTATMIGISRYGCKDTATRKITVYPQPEAEFAALPSHLYFPDNRIAIKNQTNIGNWNYFWDFADGQTSLLKEPKSHEFMRWGGYDVKLKASSLRCSDSITHHIRVFPPKPIADFDASENGCVPWTTKFSDKSTWASAWYWEFDDGSTSTEQNPSHVYETPGKYEVKLTVTGDGGSASTYRTVEVYPKPEVSFKFSTPLVMLGNAGVQFYNTSKGGARFVWDFGDSTRSTELEPIHTYTSLGKFDVTLSAWSIHNCFDSLRINEAIEVIGTGICDFPNAFKPNPNGPNGGKYAHPKDIENQVFHPYWDGVVEYHLEIYDRLGEKLFETTDILTGWDGYYRNKLCKSDVYIWKAKGKFTNGGTFDKAGDVTLLR